MLLTFFADEADNFIGLLWRNLPLSYGLPVSNSEFVLGGAFVL